MHTHSTVDCTHLARKLVLCLLPIWLTLLLYYLMGHAQRFKTHGKCFQNIPQSYLYLLSCIPSSFLSIQSSWHPPCWINEFKELQTLIGYRVLLAVTPVWGLNSNIQYLNLMIYNNSKTNKQVKNETTSTCILYHLQLFLCLLMSVWQNSFVPCWMTVVWGSPIGFHTWTERKISSQKRCR